MNMTGRTGILELELEVQRVETALPTPGDDQLNRWCRAVLDGRWDQSAAVTIRIVGEEESGQLNHQYRGKSGATNVLSFPFELPEIVGSGLIGDLVICAPVVVREASEQGKSAEAHWAHMVVHGILHLLGYDHEAESDTERMERLEREILEGLGFQDPYQFERT